MHEINETSDRPHIIVLCGTQEPEDFWFWNGKDFVSDYDIAKQYPTFGKALVGCYDEISEKLLTKACDKTKCRKIMAIPYATIKNLFTEPDGYFHFYGKTR